MLEPGINIEGRYIVERLLAKGGMATVYVVRHHQLNSLHALKVLDIPSPEIRRRMQLEGRLQASLRHPNIVSVTDTLVVEAQPALIMEYVDGPSLAGWLEEHRPSLQEGLEVFHAVLSAMEYAHDRGLVHRDLKPDNVLLAPMGGGRWLPKITDFGIAKVIQDFQQERGGGGGTRTGIAMGTPSYMAPEQIKSASKVDHRADLFSLGCILYELVCGTRAFDGDNMFSIFGRVSKGRYTAPEDLAPELPAVIREAISGCLQPDPERRIADCTSLRRLLASVQHPATSSPRTEAPRPPPVPTVPQTIQDTWIDPEDSLEAVLPAPQEPEAEPPDEAASKTTAPPEEEPAAQPLAKQKSLKPKRRRPPARKRSSGLAWFVFAVVLATAAGAIGLQLLCCCGAASVPQDTGYPITPVPPGDFGGLNLPPELQEDLVELQEELAELQVDVQAGTIGSTLQVGGIAVTVHSVEQKQKVKKGIYRVRARDGMTLLLVQITLLNEGTPSDLMLSFALVDAQGTMTQPSSTCAAALPQPLDIDSALDSAEHRTGTLCFEGAANGPWFLAFNPDWDADNGVFFQL